MAYRLMELIAPFRTARGVGNPVSLIAETSSVSRVGRGWALEGDQTVEPYIHSARDAKVLEYPALVSRGDGNVHVAWHVLLHGAAG